MPNRPIIFEKPSVKEIHRQLTPFVYDEELESQFDTLLERRKSTIDKIRVLVETKTFSIDGLVSLIKDDPEEALNAIISVLGLSQEEFFRHVTLLRFEKLTAEDVEKQTEGFTSEWKMGRITKEISKNPQFATDVIKMLLGERRREMEQRVPRFLLGKLDPNKMRLEPNALIDSLIRTGLKGRYDAQKGKPIVETAVKILKDLKVQYSDGEITVRGVSRKMDIVVPSNDNPLVFVECGVFATTARELSEKGLVERVVRQEVEKNYPDAVIVRILDGIGWLARGGDALRDVMDNSHYVLTGKTIAQFEPIVREHVPVEFFEV